MASVTSCQCHHTHLHHNVLHVLVILRVNESCELLFVCDQVSISVCDSETSLIPRHHVSVIILCVRLRVLCWRESISQSLLG